MDAYRRSLTLKAQKLLKEVFPGKIKELGGILEEFTLELEAEVQETPLQLVRDAMGGRKRVVLGEATVKQECLKGEAYGNICAYTPPSTKKRKLSSLSPSTCTEFDIYDDNLAITSMADAVVVYERHPSLFALTTTLRHELAVLLNACSILRTFHNLSASSTKTDEEASTLEDILQLITTTHTSCVQHLSSLSTITPASAEADSVTYILHRDRLEWILGVYAVFIDVMIAV